MNNSPTPYGNASANLTPINSLMQNGGGRGGSGSIMSDNQQIRKGWASVKEDGIKSLGLWSKKHLILRELQLEFLKNDAPTTTASITIQLKDIVSVNRVELKPFCIEVVRTTGNQGADAPRRTIWISLKSDQELYAWMDDVYSRCPSMGGVSNPTNFTHKVHVGFDPVSGGFTGLPEEWSKLLNNSAITREDYQKNPEAVIEVLEFYTEGQQRLQNPNMYAMNAPQQRTQFPPPPASNAQRLQQQEDREREQWEREQKQEKIREEERQRDLQREREEKERRQRELEKQQERRERERREREEDEMRRQMQLQQQQQQQQQQQEDEEDVPQKTSTAQTPIMMGGGGGGFSSSAARNPMSAKGTKIPQKSPSTREMQPHRTAPRAPGQPPRQASPATNLRLGANKPEQKREPSPAARPQEPKAATPVVKPLNVPNKTQAKEVQAREQRKENKRISNMTEAQVMEKLRSVVSSGDPNQSYTKIKKVGQGASGSVYVAKVNSSPASQVAMSLLRAGKNTPRVAIKQMDLAHQPRKELIVNEILVMKESQHPNIVNFLDAFLKGTTELWVVMEYMEGGALTDVIDNNNLKEDQIATICFEVRGTPPHP